jgi:hypothetical protein
VAANWSAFASAIHSADINVFANGTLLNPASCPGICGVWTGTNPDGTASGNNCLGWTDGSNVQSGDYGDAFSPSDLDPRFTWTTDGTAGAAACSDPQYLYCVQQ